MSMGYWAGYSMTARDVTGIRAEWQEPAVSGVTWSSEYLWVGIGSWYTTPVVQAGTYVIFDEGDDEAHSIWYERYPRDPRAVTVDSIAVGNGDTIAASVTLLPGPGHRWRMTVRDVTLGASWSKTVSYKIAHSDADFIVEDPSVNSAGTLAPFANWGLVRFTGMEVRVGQRWLPAGTLPALRIDMIQHRHTKASAGTLTPTGTSFTATQN
jgi:hypothetical protein